jgi:hypothetical protein
MGGLADDGEWGYSQSQSRVELDAIKALPVLAAEDRPGVYRSEVVMAEFFRRFFTIYNLYGMGMCVVFLGAWFYFSREQQSNTVDLLARRRRPQLPPGN